MSQTTIRDLSSDGDSDDDSKLAPSTLFRTRRAIITSGTTSSSTLSHPRVRNTRSASQQAWTDSDGSDDDYDKNPLATSRTTPSKSASEQASNGVIDLDLDSPEKPLTGLSRHPLTSLGTSQEPTPQPMGKGKRHSRYLDSDAESDNKPPSPPKKQKKEETKTKTKSGNELTKKEEKEAARLERARAKEEKQRLEKAEKDAKAALKAANKLVASKADLIKNFTLHLSSGLRGTVFANATAARLAEHGCPVSYSNSTTEPALVRWERRISARYDETERLWIPVPEYTRFEGTNLIYIRAEDLIQDEAGVALLESRITNLRREYNLTRHHQIFLIIDDMEAHYRKKGKGSRAVNAQAIKAGYHLIDKQTMERALAAMQVEHRVFIVHVEGAEDAAEWIYNITGDIGVKPHKLIERSHLPFCALQTVKPGKDKEDTFRQMLCQLNRMTEFGANAVIAEVRSLRGLFEAYENEPDARGRAEILAGSTVKYNADGSKSGRALGVALSSKVAAAFWSNDSLMELP